MLKQMCLLKTYDNNIKHSEYDGFLSVSWSMSWEPFLIIRGMNLTKKKSCITTEPLGKKSKYLELLQKYHSIISIGKHFLLQDS